MTHLKFTTQKFVRYLLLHKLKTQKKLSCYCQFNLMQSFQNHYYFGRSEEE